MNLHISVASYLANRLYDGGFLSDDSANLVFDRLTDALQDLPDHVLGELHHDILTRKELHYVEE